MIPIDTPRPKKLSVWTKLAFGAGDFGPAVTANILVFFLLYFFTSVAGLPGGMAGSILMIGKIWDGINDPIIGVMSDRTKHPWGRRYPWMVFGAIPLGISFFLQWLIPTNNQWGLFWYYVIIGIIFNTAYTAVNLPYTALTPEITQDYDERTSLNSFRFSFSIGGSILSLIIAKIIEIILRDDPPKQYLVLGAVCGILAILPTFWCFLGTKKQVLSSNQEDYVEETSPSLPIVEQLRIVFANRPFLYVIGIYLCSWLAVQLTGSIIPFFVVNCMKLPYSDFIQLSIAVQGTALIMLFVWKVLSDRLGKKVVYYLGMGLWILAQAGLFFLQPGQVIWMYFLAIIAGCGVSTAYLIPWSMIPDVIELDELQTGQRREGIFYAFMVLLQKVGLAIGLFLVGQALQVSGFIETAAGEVVEQPASALFAIRIAIGPLPTFALIIGLVLAYFYPITREFHQEILLKLQERKSRTKDEL